MSQTPSKAVLEHANITVADARATAEKLCELFDWTIRWDGEVLNGLGRSVHVGGEDYYLALYAPAEPKGTTDGRYQMATIGSLNHIGVVVEDLDAMEERVKAHGYETKLHADYEPGRRFYFDFEDNLEIEIVSYA